MCQNRNRVEVLWLHMNRMRLLSDYEWNFCVFHIRIEFKASQTKPNQTKVKQTKMIPSEQTPHKSRAITRNSNRISKTNCPFANHCWLWYDSIGRKMSWFLSPSIKYTKKNMFFQLKLRENNSKNICGYTMLWEIVYVFFSRI